MKQKILLNSLLAGIVLLVIVLWDYLINGEPINVKLLFLLPIFMPAMGFMTWLRWDWARQQRTKKLAERERQKDVDTFT